MEYSTQSSIGVYIHIPWCRSICTYCDFDRQAHGFDAIPAYVDALRQEIRQQPQEPVHSVFFGGGTPSLLAAERVAAILETCRSHFNLLADAEVTVEANPGDLDAVKVAKYREAGVNRFSLGVQSFDDHLLRLLHRRHNAAEAEKALREARAGGAKNLSFDLMYGLPGQTSAHWRETLERAVALEPDHISAYLLTVDDQVPLGRQVTRGSLSLPEDDDLAQMYDDARRLLTAAGLEQYEISNWARPGRQSRHNLTYWRDEPYLGIGAGAASSYGGRRYKNAPDPDAYTRALAKSSPAPLIEEEVIDPLTAALDHLTLALRLREGLDLAGFSQRFERDLLELGAEELAALLRTGVVEETAGRLRIGEAHLLVSNEVIIRLRQAVEASWARLRETGRHAGPLCAGR